MCRYIISWTLELRSCLQPGAWCVLALKGQHAWHARLSVRSMRWMDITPENAARPRKQTVAEHVMMPSNQSVTSVEVHGFVGWVASAVAFGGY